MATYESKDQNENGSLSLKDTLDLALKAGDKIDINWRQYFTVVFALLAWSSSNISRIGLFEAAFLTIAIVTFSVFNCVALIRAYIIMGLFTDEANALARESTFVNQRVQKFTHLDRPHFRFSMRIPLAITAHLLAVAGICYLGWSEAFRIAIVR